MPTKPSLLAAPGFAYRVEQDLHGVWHLRRGTGACVGCVEADVFEILRQYFAQLCEDRRR